MDEAAHALGQRGLDQLAELADDPALWRDLDRSNLDDLVREPARVAGATGGRELKVEDAVACVCAVVVGNHMSSDAVPELAREFAAPTGH